MKLRSANGNIGYLNGSVETILPLKSELRLGTFPILGFMEVRAMGFPSYRRHTKGQARVTLAGRDFLLGPYGSKESKAKYHRLISEYIASGKSKSFKVEPTSLSVSEVLVAYLAHAKEIYGVSKRGEYYQIKLAMRPVRQLYGSLLASEFGSTEWKTVRKYIVDGKNGNPKAPLRLPSRR